MNIKQNNLSDTHVAQNVRVIEGAHAFYLKTVYGGDLLAVAAYPSSLEDVIENYHLILCD